MRVLCWLAVLLCAIGRAAPTCAQQITTGTITGIATDDQGLPLRGSQVSLTNEETTDVRRAATNDAGLFVIPALSPGRYTLSITADGFQNLQRRGIRLRANEIYDAGTVTLTIGSFTDTTIVGAETAVVQTASADRSVVVETEQVNSLLARGRDPISLLNTLPGVAPFTEVTSLGGQIGPLTPNMAGHRSASAGMAVDGMASSAR